jgi:hypothetical protein
MQQRTEPQLLLAQRATSWSLVCCCALVIAIWISSPLNAQQRRVYSPAPDNPLRTSVATNPIRLDAAVQPAQAIEPLPSPLRRSPAEPELTSPSTPRGESSILTPQSQIITNDPYAGWPGEAPAQQHYAQQHYLPRNGHHAAHEPRDPWFANNDPNDPDRHTGWGDPLTGTSWLNRPWYWGVFIGGLLADDLVEGHVEQANAPILGLRLGHDFDHFWGWEARYAFARTELFDGAGDPIAEPARDYFVDVNLLYYPFGDSRWRPYLLAGVGFANFRFEDDAGHFIDDTALTIPLGFGLKHYYSPWFTLRFDFVDTISMSTGQLDAMNNFSLMAGAEFRFGGTRPSYFPWTGNTSYW